VSSLSCLFGFHRPSLSSIARRSSGLAGLCESCGRSLVKGGGEDKWTVAEPLDKPLQS